MKQLRPFELDIIKSIRVHPEQKGGGGRSVPRKGVWIRGHLLECGPNGDYPYRMWRLWREFLEEAELKIKAGNYQAFRTYVYVLRRLGLIRRAGGDPSRFGKKYYALNPDKVNSPSWRHPFKNLSRTKPTRTLYV